MGGVLYGGGWGEEGSNALGDLVYGEIVGMADWGEEILEEEGMGGYGGGKVASAANYLGPLPSKQNLASTIFIGVDWIVDGAGSHF